jgi:hypothetical protein
VKPNPGSVDALKEGCNCPVLDNNHGQYPPFPAGEGREDGWYMRMDCPVHGYGDPVTDVETGDRL